MSRIFLTLRSLIYTPRRGTATLNRPAAAEFPIICALSAAFSHASAVSVPPPPKKPPNAYMRFLKDRRVELFREKSDVKPREQCKILAAEWKMLDKARRDAYQEEYLKDYATYVQLNQAYVTSLTDEQREELKQQQIRKREKRIHARMNMKLRELNMPKRPPAALSIFMNENNLTLKGKKLPEFMKFVSEEWKKLTDDEKKVYQSKAEHQRIKWAKDLLQWKQQMLEEGHQDVLDYLEKKKGGSKSSLEVSTSKAKQRPSKKA